MGCNETPYERTIMKNPIYKMKFIDIIRQARAEIAEDFAKKKNS